MLTFRIKTMTLLSPGGASIIIPTHRRPSPCRPSSTSSLTSHPRASRFFAPCKQMCHLLSATSPRVPGATWSQSCPTRSSLRQCPVPGSWTADEILSAAKRIFRNPGLAWTVTPGAGGHRQVRTNFAIINHWNTGAVNVPGRDSHMVSNQIQSTRPGPVCTPSTSDPAWYSSPRRRKRNSLPTFSPGPPLVGVTPSPHPHSPLRYPSLNTGPFPPLAQPDTELFEDHSPFAQHPGHQVPRRRPVTQGPHASAAFFENGRNLADGDVSGNPRPLQFFWYF